MSPTSPALTAATYKKWIKWYLLIISGYSSYSIKRPLEMLHLHIGWFPQWLRTNPTHYRKFTQPGFSRRNQGSEHQQLHILNLILPHTFWISLLLPTEKITEPNWNTCPEEWVSSKSKSWKVLFTISATAISNLSLQNDCHDDSINSDCFTENNAIL